jgi:hypothetical protein
MTRVVRMPGSVSSAAVLRVERRQLGEVGPLARLLRVEAVHRVEADERVVLVLALALALLAHGARDGVAAAQAVLADCCIVT